MGLYQIKNCLDCNKSFTGHIACKRCPECREDKEEKVVYEKICKYDKCKAAFSTTRTDQKFCNRSCRKQHHSDVYYRRKSDG